MAEDGTTLPTTSSTEAATDLAETKGKGKATETTPPHEDAAVNEDEEDDDEDDDDDDDDEEDEEEVRFAMMISPPPLDLIPTIVLHASTNTMSYEQTAEPGKQ